MVLFMMDPVYEELCRRIQVLEEETAKQRKVIGELEGRIRELSETSQDLAHHVLKSWRELQKPLEAVQTYLQFVEARYKDRLDADGARFIESAVDGATRIEALVDAWLASLKNRD
jgi:light-regulated signal transduction histidine kinase (bacteriophytochrome)